MANYGAYSVSKAAIISLIKTLALEIKETGVTANVVLPSVIDTPANRAAMPDADYSKWVTAESIAHLLVWLASGKAADVNGAVIPMYGKS
jgi:NAD(P)-dependent dehydrogenase (short-subunit alcohol dehydrogenase family)